MASVKERPAWRRSATRATKRLTSVSSTRGLRSEIEAAHVPVQDAVAGIDIDRFVAAAWREMFKIGEMFSCAGQRRNPQRVALEPDPVAPGDRRLKAVPPVSKSGDVVARYPRHSLLLTYVRVLGADGHGNGLGEDLRLRFEAQGRVSGAIA